MSDQRTLHPGNIVWRGYARTYGNDRVYWPEIRPGTVRHIHTDGTIDVALEGRIPSSDYRSSGGSWIAFRQNRRGYFATPEEALAHAKLCVDETNGLAETKE